MFVCLGTAVNLCYRGKETFMSINCQLSNWQYLQSAPVFRIWISQKKKKMKT